MHTYTLRREVLTKDDLDEAIEIHYDEEERIVLIKYGVTKGNLSRTRIKTFFPGNDANWDTFKAYFGFSKN